MTVAETGAPPAVQTFRPCGRAFYLYYIAMFLCFVGPVINPEVGLPVWLGWLLGAILVAAVLYQMNQEYQITPTGVRKVIKWPAAVQEIPWKHLGEVKVMRGFTQTMLRVGNLRFDDTSGGPPLFWFGLSDPKAVREAVEARRP